MQMRSRNKRLAAERLEHREMFAVPDFSLVDVNPATPSYQQDVSPRDYLGKVSAWYFIHTT